MKRANCFAAFLTLGMTTLLGNAQDGADPCVEKDLTTLDLCSWRTTPSGALTDRVTYDGKKTIELEGNASPDVVTAAAWQNPDIRLLAGQRYTVAALVKTDGASAVSLAIDIPQEVPVEGLRSRSISPTTNWSTSPTGRTVVPGWPCSTTGTLWSAATAWTRPNGVSHRRNRCVRPPAALTAVRSSSAWTIRAKSRSSRRMSQPSTSIGAKAVRAL